MLMKEVKALINSTKAKQTPPEKKNFKKHS